jgi:hypothetical protein
MEPSPSCKANTYSSSASKIPHILWNPKVHYHVHKSLALVFILSWIDPIHTLPTKLFELQFNIILPSIPKSSIWSLSVMVFYDLCVFPPKPCICLSSLLYVPHAAWFDLIIQTMFGEEYKSCSSSSYSFLWSAGNSSILGLYVFFSTIVVNTQPMFFPQCERPSFTAV